MIVFEGLGKKYWNTILSHIKGGNIEKVINHEYSLPLRLTLFPGMSCMYYCGFCGRNQTAKYPLNILDDSLKMYKKLFDESPEHTAYSISGGLEPLTNFKLGEIIKYANESGKRMPVITNGYSLTPNYFFWC